MKFTPVPGEQQFGGQLSWAQSNNRSRVSPGSDPKSAEGRVWKPMPNSALKLECFRVARCVGDHQKEKRARSSEGVAKNLAEIAVLGARIDKVRAGTNGAWGPEPAGPARSGRQNSAPRHQRAQVAQALVQSRALGGQCRCSPISADDRPRSVNMLQCWSNAGRKLTQVDLRCGQNWRTLVGVKLGRIRSSVDQHRPSLVEHGPALGQLRSSPGSRLRQFSRHVASNFPTSCQ